MNNLIELNIEKLNINAEGIGYFNNKKVVVKNVLPKERVLVQVHQEKPSCLFASLKQVLTPSPLRVNPPCKYYGICGGCDFQFANPKDVLVLKQQIFSDYFKDIFAGKIVINSSESQFYYRNKMSFYVSNNKIGMLCENTNNVVEIDKCLIANEQINLILTICKNWIKHNSANHVVIRTINKKFILTVVVGSKNNPNINLLVEALIKSFNKNSFGVYINKNLNNKQILSDNWQYVYGLKNLSLEIFDLSFQIHPGSFLQVNLPVAQKMYEKVCNFVDNKVVVEGYSGVGILSAILSKTAKKVYSVEINKNAHMDAQKMKNTNNLVNLKNIHDSCENALPILAKENRNCVFVLDPPRSGCDKKTLEAIVKNNISEVIYISCNPYTLKQNLYLLKDNYKVESFEISDMFPNTSKIECLVRLVKNK